MLGSTSSGALSTITDIISNALDKNYTMKQAASELGALMNELELVKRRYATNRANKPVPGGICRVECRRITDRFERKSPASVAGLLRNLTVL
jgi:hypothetical protein